MIKLYLSGSENVVLVRLKPTSQWLENRCSQTQFGRTCAEKQLFYILSFIKENLGKKDTYISHNIYIELHIRIVYNSYI